MQYNYYTSEELESFKSELIEELVTQWDIDTNTHSLLILVDAEDMLMLDFDAVDVPNINTVAFKFDSLERI